MNRVRLRELLGRSPLNTPGNQFIHSPALHRPCGSTPRFNKPDTESGEGYCDRSFAGVCNSCDIPPNGDTTGRELCTFGVLWNKHYNGEKKFFPKCKTQHA